MICASQVVVMLGTRERSPNVHGIFSMSPWTSLAADLFDLKIAEPSSRSTLRTLNEEVHTSSAALQFPRYEL